MKTVSEANYEMANADIDCFTRLTKYTQAHENLMNASKECDIAEKEYLDAVKRQKKARRNHVIAKIVSKLSKLTGVKRYESTI